MLFALFSLWSVQEIWNVGASSINVMYDNPYQFSILADDFVILDDTFYKLLPDTIKPVRTLVDGDTVVFITANIDYPVIVYVRSDSSLRMLDRRGAYSDYDPVSGLVIPVSPIFGGRPFSISENPVMNFTSIYGRRIFTFGDSLLYVDGSGNLRSISGRLIAMGVKDALPYGDTILIIQQGGVELLDRGFRQIDRFSGDFHIASSFSYGGRDVFLIASGDSVYMLMDFLKPLFRVPDSIMCVAPVDYDMDGFLELLISAGGRMYLYDEEFRKRAPGADVRLVDFPGYGYPSTCGGMYGAKLMNIERSENRIDITFIPGGWRVFVEVPAGGPVRIYVVDSRGIRVFEDEVTANPGMLKIDIRDHFRPGTYSIVIEGEDFRIKRTVIWKGR